MKGVNEPQIILTNKFRNDYASNQPKADEENDETNGNRDGRSGC